MTRLEREMVALQSHLYTDVRTKEDDLDEAKKGLARLTQDATDHSAQLARLQTELQV